MLIDIREILGDAKKKGYGVVSTSPVFEFLVAPIVRACEEKHSPLILSVTENQMVYDDIDNVGPKILFHAQKASIPIAVILDHGKTIQTITKAIRMGFNAIMFDGSDLLLGENIKQTAYFSEIAHTFNIAIEGELGYIGGHEGTTIKEKEEGYQYTDVSTAQHFFEATGVDILAVAVGNVHGVTSFTPHLDFNRLRKISEVLPIPLAMHGCSGMRKADIQKSIVHGLSKVNFYSDMSKNMVRGVRDLSSDPSFINFPLLLNRAQEIAFETMCDCCDTYGSSGKA